PGGLSVRPPPYSDSMDDRADGCDRHLQPHGRAVILSPLWTPNGSGDPGFGSVTLFHADRGGRVGRQLTCYRGGDRFGLLGGRSRRVDLEPGLRCRWEIYILRLDPGRCHGDGSASREIGRAHV